MTGYSRNDIREVENEGRTRAGDQRGSASHFKHTIMKYILILFFIGCSAIVGAQSSVPGVTWTEDSSGNIMIREKPLVTFKGEVVYYIGGEKFLDSCDVVCQIFYVGNVMIPNMLVKEYAIRKVMVGQREIPYKAWIGVWVDGWRIYTDFYE